TIPLTKDKNSVISKSTLSRPLTAFNNPPIPLHEQLKKQNYQKQTINIQITTSKMDITNLGNRTIAIAQINNNQPIASYNRNWPSKMNATCFLFAFLLTTTKKYATINLNTICAILHHIIQQLILLQP
ncbi:1880_t:CDS:1, partial [Gigaspora rosea]